MLSNVKLVCPKCDEVCRYSLPYIQGQIKVMKKHKYEEAAKQLQEKRGPFYDKWLAAMEARGEQMRCNDCLSHHANDLGLPRNYCIYWQKVVNPGQFTCKGATFYRG